MRRFKNILLVAENGIVGPDAGSRALTLAQANGASVTLIDVIAVEGGDFQQLLGTLGGSSGNTVEEQLLAIRKAELNQLAIPFREAGIEVDTLVMTGTPFIEVIREVLRKQHDLVMKAAGEEGSRRWRVFSSTELHLLRKCPCPVWLVRPRRGMYFDSIMAAVDPFPEDQEDDPLGRLIMDLATSLSVMENSALSIVHAWHLVGERAMRNSAMAKIPKAEINRLVEEQRKKDEARLVRLVEQYPQVQRSQVHMVKGEPEDVIVDYAQQFGADLIVMGTIGHAGVRGLLIGNTAESVLTRVDCSVMAVKPADFETPVRLDE